MSEGREAGLSSLRRRRKRAQYQQALDNDVLTAAKAYVREWEHPVPDTLHRMSLHEWLVECVTKRNEAMR